jgi:hypothetical protein
MAACSSPHQGRFPSLPPVPALLRTHSAARVPALLLPHASKLPTTECCHIFSIAASVQAGIAPGRIPSLLPCSYPLCLPTPTRPRPASPARAHARHARGRPWTTNLGPVGRYGGHSPSSRAPSPACAPPLLHANIHTAPAPASLPASATLAMPAAGPGLQSSRKISHFPPTDEYEPPRREQAEHNDTPMLQHHQRPPRRPTQQLQARLQKGDHPRSPG